MKKKTTKNNVYRTLGFGAVKAPTNPECGAKADRIVTKGDLRAGAGKK